MTNSLTKAVVTNFTVTASPSSGVTITTDGAGGYSGQLPVGSYSLTFKATNYNSDTEALNVTAGQSITRNVSLTPVAPVVISATVQGPTPGVPIKPGDNVVVTGTVTALDGTTPGTITWTQKSGAPVQLSPGGAADVHSNTVQAALPNLTAFKDEFFKIVDEERHALLNRNMVMGVNPFDLEEAGAVVLKATVQSGSNTYSQDVVIAVSLLPFVWTTGLQGAPIGLPVLLHAKSGASYNWTITKPSGSGSISDVKDATTQNPYFTPDVAGKYTLTETVSGAAIDVYSSLWVGEIGPDGQPSSLCAGCHAGVIAPDMFTPWKKSGHAQIFTKNLNAGGHYGPSCFPCHTVGYDLTENPVNGGFDDATGYADFLNEFFPSGHAPTPNPNNWTNMLAKYPAVAKLANIQCENCHGPIDIGTHFADDNTKRAHISLSSDVCARCHGEPPRHGRFQQWQLSLHSDYALASSEGASSNCSRCHTGNGFLVWLDQTADKASMDQQILNPQTGANATAADLANFFGMTADTVHPQTCATCHEPHEQGNGGANATVRIDGDTKALPSGYTAIGVGKGALCITCHNTRNGAHDNQHLPSSYPANQQYRAPHVAAQGDVLMGQNAYFVSVPQRSRHSYISDTCATCHLVLSPPPPQLSLAGGGTNHAFKASLGICGHCHGDFDGGTLQASVEAKIEDLASAMDTYLMAKITGAVTITISDYTPHQFGGKNYDLKSDPVAVPASNIVSVSPTEVHGQQGFFVKFNTPVQFTYSPSGETPHTQTLQQATVRLGDFFGSDGTTALIPATPVTDPLILAGWNYWLVNSDTSRGVHNPSFVMDVLNESIAAL